MSMGAGGVPVEQAVASRSLVTSASSAGSLIPTNDAGQLFAHTSRRVEEFLHSLAPGTQRRFALAGGDTSPCDLPVEPGGCKPS